MTCRCPDKRELEGLSKCLLGLFLDRCRKSERARLARAGKYWEART